MQEDAGIDVVGDGEQSRQHFVHGFLGQVEGIDFEHKVKMGIRDNRYDAMVPQVVGPLRLAGRVHATRGAARARAHRQAPEVHAARADDDRRHRRRPLLRRRQGGRIKMAFAFAELLNQEARALEADGVDIVQFDEPAFNVYMADAAEWGVAALERAAEGLTCKTAVHICYGYGIKANVDWKQTLGDEWRQYEQVFPALAKSRIDQVSLECYHSHVPAELMRLLDGKDVMVGVIDVASDVIETPEQVADDDRRRRCATCRPSASSRAPTAAWRRCGARSPRPSSRRSAQGAALARARRGAMSARRAERTDDRASTVSPPRSRGAATPSSRRPISRASPARRVAELDALRPSWDALPPDAHLRDGGRYRRRRHASFVVDGSERSSWCRIARTGSRSNTTRCTAASSAGSSRSTADVVARAGVARHPARVRRASRRRLKGAQPWYVEAHQFRIDTTDGIGRPTPEGAHRDGVDFVAVVLVGREGIKGGETRVFAADGPEGPALHDARAVDHARARRRARDPREHADPAARGLRPSRHARPHVSRRIVPGAGSARLSNQAALSDSRTRAARGIGATAP